MKDITKILLAFLLFTATLIFPLAKIIVAVFVVSILVYNYYKWKNWTFLVPAYGASFNTAAILANGNKMPVLNPLPGSLDINHVALTSHTHLKFLCDLYPLWSFGVFSYGDVIIAVIWPLTVLGYYWYTNSRKVGK